MKRRKIDTDHCIICFKPLNPKKQEVVKNPTFNGLSAIFKASQIRKDDVYESIWPLQQDILSLDLKVSFHKSCRAKYTSKSNISTSNPSESDQQPCTSAATEHTRISRNETAGFDIRTNCFICGKSNTSRNKLTPVSTGTGQSTREKVLAAADKRQDNKIHMRMLAFPDFPPMIPSTTGYAIRTIFQKGTSLLQFVNQERKQWAHYMMKLLMN